MTTIIKIDGGVGRVMAAIPALMKYNKLHQGEEWYVMIAGWDYMFWGIPELQNRTFNSESKGVFQNYFWKADKVIAPEPYKVPAYYRQEISLAEAFDIEINGSDSTEPLCDIFLSLSQQEIEKGKSIVSSLKQMGKNKTIIFQPFGSTASKSCCGSVDFTLRSLKSDVYMYMVKKLSEFYNVVYMGNKDLKDDISIGLDNLSEREWAAVIKAADYFIGCDSCGQHMAKAVGTDASVFISGTHEKNISYPEHFHIIKRNLEFTPSPYRLSQLESDLANRLNGHMVDFTNEELDVAYFTIVRRIEKTKKMNFLDPKNYK